MKKLLSLIMVAAVFCGCLTLSSCNSVSSRNSFSFWLSSGVSATYYTKYEDNPILQYIMKHKQFASDKGGEANIDFKFTIPVKGQEGDSFNTLLSTNSYTDVFDTLHCSTPVADLYKEGKILDLTDYVKNNMPNYKKFIEENPDLAPYFTTTVDGEEKYLEFRGMSDSLNVYDQFCGYMYRRDWIIKYGEQPAKLWSLDSNNQKVFRDNPDAGKKFSGAYTLDKEGKTISATELTDNVDGDSWVDNVIFPSGSSDPLYISDWEWMMEFFDKAIKEQSVNDGYVMSLWYPGFVNNGELSNAFGGNCPDYYMDKETGNASFGGASEGFKTYMETMNKWYTKGWIDKAFSEKSSDVFYDVDRDKIYQGKIGLWMGTPSSLGTRMYSDKQALTKNIMVAGAANPINDVYGSDAVKFKEPYVMFQNDQSGSGIVITDKAKDKDVLQLISFFDYLYSEEGSLLRTVGLSKEQYDESQSPVYKQNGLTEGAYTKTDDGKCVFVPIMMQDAADIRGAMTLSVLPGLTSTSVIKYDYAPTYIHWREQWIKYKATGFFGTIYNSRVTPDDMKDLNKIRSTLMNEYAYIEVPKFVTGKYNFTSDYDSFISGLKKRNYEKGVGYYQKAVDAVNKLKESVNLK